MTLFSIRYCIINWSAQFFLRTRRSYSCNRRKFEIIDWFYKNFVLSKTVKNSFQNDAVLFLCSELWDYSFKMNICYIIAKNVLLLATLAEPSIPSILSSSLWKFDNNILFCNKWYGSQKCFCSVGNSVCHDAHVSFFDEQFDSSTSGWVWKGFYNLVKVKKWVHACCISFKHKALLKKSICKNEYFVVL